jgi:hypothetical protein
MMNPYGLMMKGVCSVGRLADLNNAQCTPTYAAKLWGMRTNPESSAADKDSHKFAAWPAGNLSSFGSLRPHKVKPVFGSPFCQP